MSATPEHAARVLDLSLEASLDDVKCTRRKMALKYHPDTSGDQERSTRHMARINAAADTLIAHIKKQATYKPKGKRPVYTDFSACKNAGQSSARSKEPIRKSSPQKGDAGMPNHKSRLHAQSQNTHAVRKPEQHNTASRAEEALIRFASASYSNVLNRIGRNEVGPKVDVTVLRFQGVR